MAWDDCRYDGVGIQLSGIRGLWLTCSPVADLGGEIAFYILSSMERIFCGSIATPILY